jgi:uridine kinase
LNNDQLNSFNKNDIYFIGIAGGSASGKTYFIEALRKSFSLGDVCIISQDDYYKPLEEQQKDENAEVNFDLPGAIDSDRFLADLEKLARKQTISIKEYNFNNPEHTPQLKYICHAPVIVVEGLFIMHFKAIKNLLGLKVFVDAKEDIKLSRRLLRDEAERGITKETILYQWNNHVIPAYKKFLLPYRDECDIIITNNTSFHKGLELITDHIRAQVFRRKDNFLES